MFDSSQTIESFDPEIVKALKQESQRQEQHIELIASENYASPLAVSYTHLTLPTSDLV